MRHRGPVGPIGCERFVDVGDGHDPCPHRELRLGQAAEVPAPVEALVVAGGELGHGRERRHGFQDPQRQLGVAPDDLELRGLEARRLVQDHVRHPELADVVQQAGPTHVDDVALRQPEVDGDPLGQSGDALRVRPGERALRIDDVRERGRQAVDIDVEAGVDPLDRRRAPSSDPTMIGLVELVEQAAGRQVEERVDDVGLVPAPPACRQDRQRLRDGRARRRRGRAPARRRDDPRVAVDVGARPGRAGARRRPSARARRGRPRRLRRRSRPCARSPRHARSGSPRSPGAPGSR